MNGYSRHDPDIKAREAAIRAFHPGPDKGYIGQPGPARWYVELMEARREES